MRNKIKNNPDKKDKNKEKVSAGLVIFLIIAVIVIIVLLAIIIYFLFKAGSQTALEPSSSLSASPSESSTAPPEQRAGWETYTNSRFSYSLEVPPDLEKTESQNGDGATFTTWNPPMTIRVWGENNSLNLTAQQAIDFDKNDLAVNEVENLRVIVEGTIEMGGEEAVESVWQYTAPSTGDATTSARAYTVKGDAIYKIEFLIDSERWNQYSTTFDEIFSSFQFL